MAKLNGTLNAIISGSDRLLHIQNATLNVNVDLPDATTKESAGWAEHINGQRDWGISFDGAYDVLGSGMTPDEILAIIIARTADAAIKFTTDGATGAVGWTGNATVQNFSLVGNKETPATFSGSLKGNGALAAIA
jgi:predicted secreted protein